MIEYNLINILLKKDKYNLFYNTVLNNIQNTELKKILYSLKVLHQSSSKEECSVEELEMCFLTEYPSLKESEKKIFEVIFERIRKTEIDESLVDKYLTSLRNKSLAHSIATAALEVYEDRKDISSVLDLISQVDLALPITDEIKFVTSDLNELYNSHSVKQGLRWRLKFLNESLGSLRKGDFGFLFARPESGKTTFLASEVSFMAQQVTPDHPILWCNNEEQGEKVMRRIYSATLGKTEREIFSAIDTNQDSYQTAVGGRLILLDEASLTKQYLDKVIKKVNPSLIIFDQIDKIKGFDADRNDLVLGKTYQWAREVAKTYCPVIAVCQADGTGEGVKWLTMGHVADAKTAKQAEADWILGIGKSNDEGYEYIRYLNISKNKLSGDEDSVPSLRHGRAEVLIKPEVARYEDIDFS